MKQVIKRFKFKYEIQEGETCFSYLGKYVAEIDKAAEVYLSQFEFVPSDKIADDIYDRAWKVFEDNDKDWDKIPEWVSDVLDCGVPFCNNSCNGSLWYSLGLSLLSRDAHLRCFWENVKNDTERILPFPIVVPKDIDETTTNKGE